MMTGKQFFKIYHSVLQMKTAFGAIKKFYVCVTVLVLANTMCLAQQPSVTELSLLLTGNTYGYFDVTPVGKNIAGGIVRRKTIVDQVRREVGRDHLLLLDAGNALGYYYLLRGNKGAAMVSAMRTVGYDAMTIGSHELDYGKDALGSYNAASTGLNFVCANLIDKSTGKPHLRSSIIVQKADGLRVAVLGLTDPEIRESTLKQHIEGLDILDPITIAQAAIPRLRAEADIVVVLTHLSTDDCYRLAMSVPGIDVIIGRADSTTPSTTLRKESIESKLQTLIVSPVWLGSGVTRVQLRFNRTDKTTTAATQDIIPVIASVAGDVEFATQLATASEQQYYEYSRSAYGVDPDEPLLLVDDAFTNADFIRLALHILLQQTGSEIALLNNSLFRFDGVEFPRYDGDLRYRKISVRLLEQILWADNELATMRLTGQQLSALQRISTANASTGKENFLYHLQVTTDGNEEWYVHNAPLQQKYPPELYSIVTSNFLAGGAEGFTPFREARHLSSRFAGTITPKPTDDGKPIIIRDFIIQYLKRQRDGQRLRQTEATAVIDSAYRTRNLWRFSLARLQLSYSAGQYRSNEDYRNVGLTELRATDFQRITYETDVRLKQESKLLIWDNRLFAAFGQYQVTGQQSQEIADDLFFETILNFRSSRATRDIAVYPSASLRYDTEITATESIAPNGETIKNPRQQDLTLGAGIGFSDFYGFSRTRISLTQTFDRSRNPRPDENGINLQTMYQLALGTAVFRSEFDGTLYIKLKETTRDTRKLLVRWRNDLGIPLGGLTLAPSLNIFLFQGQTSSDPARSPRIATAIVFGLTLGYSKDWKMQYEPLF